MSRLVTISEAARALGVSEKTLRRYEKQGVVKPIRTLGGQRRYYLQAIRDLLAAAEDDDEEAELDRRAVNEPRLTPDRPSSATPPEEPSPWDEVEEERASFDALKVRTAREDYVKGRQDAAQRAERERLARLEAERRAAEERAGREREERERASLKNLHDMMARAEVGRGDYYLLSEPNEAHPAIRKALLALLTPGRIPDSVTAAQMTQLVRDEIARIAAPFRRVHELRDAGAKYADRELDDCDVDYGTRCRIRRAVEAELLACVTPQWTPHRVERTVDALLDDLLGAADDG